MSSIGLKTTMVVEKVGGRDEFVFTVRAPVQYMEDAFVAEVRSALASEARSMAWKWIGERGRAFIEGSMTEILKDTKEQATTVAKNWIGQNISLVAVNAVKVNIGEAVDVALADLKKKILGDQE